MTERQHATWGELLREAVEKPGRMLEAYTAFHNYSFGNALLALEQCTRRNLQPGPLNTYHGWLERKRQVRKGEKGITLCMPMPLKKTAQNDSVQEETAEPQTCYAFRFRAYWFVLAQTEGEDTSIPPTPGFDIDTALCALNITRAPFDELNGNIQGFAHGRLCTAKMQVEARSEFFPGIQIVIGIVKNAGDKNLTSTSRIPPCQRLGGDVEAGVFPKREEILIVRLGLGRVALQCVGAGEAIWSRKLVNHFWLRR